MRLKLTVTYANGEENNATYDTVERVSRITADLLSWSHMVSVERIAIDFERDERSKR